jgi:hypothetical protein
MYLRRSRGCLLSPVHPIILTNGNSPLVSKKTRTGSIVQETIENGMLLQNERKKYLGSVYLLRKGQPIQSHVVIATENYL